MSEIVWLRVLDTSGSWHPCAKGDPGATAFVKAALPSGHEGLVDELKDVVRLLDFEGYVGAAQSVSEAIAALGRAEPVAGGDWIETASVMIAAKVCDWYDAKAHIPGDRIEAIIREYATPPAPQPALALIEELERALTRMLVNIDTSIASGAVVDSCHQARTALASAKRFKGE